jgi:DNA-binding GntR family transcriptional regulator
MAAVKGKTAVDDAASAPTPARLLNASVYEELRQRMITGKIMPGVGLSTRGLALELGVSQMPVRDSMNRLAADGAVQIRSKRRIETTAMTAERFDDLLACRLLLEPEAAVLALPYMNAAFVKRLRAIDRALDRSIETGDVLAYMENNFAFHFAIYGANRRPTLNRLIQTLWLQFGPYMRVVYGRYGTADLVDQHRLAIDAIAAGDAVALRDAMASDIADGMGLIGRDGLGLEGAPSTARP